MSHTAALRSQEQEVGSPLTFGEVSALRIGADSLLHAPEGLQAHNGPLLFGVGPPQQVTLERFSTVGLYPAQLALKGLTLLGVLQAPVSVQQHNRRRAEAAPQQLYCPVQDAMCD